VPRQQGSGYLYGVTSEPVIGVRDVLLKTPVIPRPPA